MHTLVAYRGRWPAMPVLLLACALAACSHPGGSATPAAAIPGAHLKPKPADDLDPDMVNAVSPGGASVIGMKFRLAARPVVGTPLQITIALLPAPDTAITHLHVAFQTGDGLQLQSDRNLDADDPRPGVPLEETLTVLPQQEGVLTLSATVVVDQESGSMARTYSIPLIAGNAS